MRFRNVPMSMTIRTARGSQAGLTFFSSAEMRFSGIPHKPKPPTRLQTKKSAANSHDVNNRRGSFRVNPRATSINLKKSRPRPTRN